MSIDWMKQGEDSAKIAAEEKAKAEQRKAEQGKAFRYFLKKQAEGKILFCDGDINPKMGSLTPPRFYEHFVMFGGQWTNIVCPQATRPDSGDKCPICESGDKPSLVSLFTVIDLVPYTSKKTGNVIPFSRKLFVCKPTTFDMLNKIAVTLGKGGLRGQTFSTARVGDKAAAVGDVYIPLDRITDHEEAKKKFTVTFKIKENGVEKEKSICMYEPLNYGKEIVFRTGDELRKMGFGAPTGAGQYQQSTGSSTGGQTESGGAASADDYADQL